MRPFSSRSFFRDEFFCKQRAGASATITINSVSVPAVVIEGLDPTRDGALLSRPGKWSEIAVFAPDYWRATTEGQTPAHGDEWTDGSTVYRVESVSLLGDAFLVKAVSNQRKGGR